MNVRHDVVEETGCRSGVQEREDVRVLERERMWELVAVIIGSAK
jgi:hypothetical protein